VFAKFVERLAQAKRGSTAPCSITRRFCFGAQHVATANGHNNEPRPGALLGRAPAAFFFFFFFFFRAAAP